MDYLDYLGTLVDATVRLYKTLKDKQWDLRSLELDIRDPDKALI